MKKIKLLSLFLLLFVISGCSSKDAGGDEKKGDAGSGKETITIKAANAYTPNEILGQGYSVFEEILNKKSDGRIKLEYVGGPETIPPFELGEALRTGVVDMMINAAAYYADQVPEGLALSYSELTTKEENEGEAIKVLNKIHNEKLNAQLISRMSEMGFHLHTKKPVEKVEDLKGMRIRGTPTYRPVIEAVGGEMVSMPGGEIYTALERGVIDGYGWVSSGITDAGLNEHTSSIIGPTFFRADIVLAFNLDTWNKIPEDLQKIIYDSAYESEARLHEIRKEYEEKEAKIFEKEGIKFVDLGEDFTKKSYDNAWGWIIKNIPGTGEELAKVFRK